MVKKVTNLKKAPDHRYSFTNAKICHQNSECQSVIGQTVI